MQARQGFEFDVSHQTKSFKPSEVKEYVLAFDKTSIDHAAPVKRQRERLLSL